LNVAEVVPEEKEAGWVQERNRCRFFTHLARTEEEVLESQRLRYRVFAGELNAQLPDDGSGADRDRFDPYCDHILVRKADGNELIGSYRILGGDRTADSVGFYSETEFDMPWLADRRARVAEIGRACVNPEYRSGAAIALLWSALFSYVMARGYEYVIGCASVPLVDGRHCAEAICRSLRRDYPPPPEFTVRPGRPFPISEGHADDRLEIKVPTLIKGYLRAGAYVCGDPAWDPEFGTADLPMMLMTASLSRRYAERLARNA
jgi:putative hemolysin